MNILLYCHNRLRRMRPRLLILFSGIFLNTAAIAGAVVPDTAAVAGAIVPAAPEVKAASYLVMDSTSGVYLVEENIELKVEPASLTKMMTAYVVASQLADGHISMADKVVVSEKAWRMTGSRTFIEVGKEVSVEDLLKGVVIQSGNDASVALAEYVSGSEAEFAGIMNRYADRLGMKDTHFVNSSGLPHEEHYTTARDLSILAKHLIKDYPAVYALHSIKEFTYNDIKQSNRNSMLWRDESVDGIKTGYTKSAGYCLVVSAERNGMRLISVVMGADSVRARTSATNALLNYSYRFFETRTLYSAGETITTGKVWKGERDSLSLVMENDLLLTLPRGQYERLQPSIELDGKLIAPIAKAQEAGHLKLLLDDKVIASRPLVALEAVPEGGFLKRFRDGVKLSFDE